MVERKIVVGRWRSTTDGAEGDVQRMRDAALRVTEGLPMTLSEAMREMLADAEQRQVSPGTLRYYRGALRKVWAGFGGDLLLEQITVGDLVKYREQRLKPKAKGRQTSPTTVDKEFAALKRLFLFAQRRGRFSGPIPTDRIDKARAKRKEPAFYSASQMKDVLSAYADQSGPFVATMHDTTTLLFATGWRASELCALRVSDINFGERYAHMQRKESESTSPLSPLAVTVLKRMTAGCKPSDYVYRRSKSEDVEQRVSALGHGYQRMKPRMPEQLRAAHHPHALRHSFETALAEAEVPFHHCVALMDHSTDQHVTSRYSHATRAGLLKSLDLTFGPLDHLSPPHGEFSP